MNESQLEDNLAVFSITGAQPKTEKTETDTKFYDHFPSNEGLDTVKPAVPKVPQVSDGTDKNALLTTSNFMTE